MTTGGCTGLWSFSATRETAQDDREEVGQTLEGGLLRGTSGYGGGLSDRGSGRREPSRLVEWSRVLGSVSPT